MKTNLLGDVEFKSTFGMPMRDVVGEASNVIDIWPYVSEVPPSDLQGHEIHDRFVEHVYRSPDNKYDHVMVTTKTQNVYLVIVVNLLNDAIYGHHLLDLNSEYGLS